jgi:membrane-associated protein
MNRLAAAFLAIPAPWVVAFVFLFPALETALVLGVFLPGEVTVVLGGVIAGRGGAPLFAVIAAGIGGAVAGDVTSYALGRRFGEDFVRKRLGSRWAPAHRWLSKERGGFTIFVGRFLPFLRSVLPMTAGALKVPARIFLPWDFAAAAIWGTGSVLLGYFAVRDLDQILRFMHRFTIAIAILLAAGGLGWLWWKRRRPRPGKGGRSRAAR